jgi:hypothetical protein
MLTSQTLARITDLGLDLITETAVIEILQDAIDAAVPIGSSVALQLPADWPADYQEQFWRRYPNKTAKPRAMKALDKIAFSGKTRWADFTQGLERYIVSPRVISGYIKGPAVWLNDEGWNDGPQPNGPKKKLSFFEIAAGHGD